MGISPYPKLILERGQILFIASKDGAYARLSVFLGDDWI